MKICRIVFEMRKVVVSTSSVGWGLIVVIIILLEVNLMSCVT